LAASSHEGRLYWDIDILDPEEEPSHKIIDAGEW